MAPRPKHPDKDLEAIIRSLEDQDWKVNKDKKYYKALCPCSEKHYKTIHNTPQKTYIDKLRTRLRNHTCWEEK